MRKLLLCATILLLSVSFSEAYAQQKTAYEKRKEQLEYEVAQRLGFSIQAGVLYNAKNIQHQLALGMMLIQDPQVAEWYSNELKKAKSLRTAEEIKREEQQKKEEEERKKEEAYQSTDRGGIQWAIKSAFEKWSIKGEYEKEADYQARLKNESKAAFDKICLEKIIAKIPNSVSLSLSTYNPDGEFFSVTAEFGGIELRSTKLGSITWQSRVNVPIATAEKFKDSWSKLQRKVGDYDWCFVENTFVPTLVKLVNPTDGATYELTSSLKNRSEITFSFDELKIANAHLKGYVFKLSEAVAKNKATGVTLSQTEATLYNKESSDRLKLSATVLPDNALNKKVDWSSSNPDVAKVYYNDGTVIAQKSGTATITATTQDGGYTATCVVMVVVPVSRIYIDQCREQRYGREKENALMLTTGNFGSYTVLTTTIEPSDAAKNVRWSSNNPAVATVDSSGKVTAIGTGEATITVTPEYGRWSATCAVTVLDCSHNITVAEKDLSKTYSWSSAKKACPKGWRLPTIDELKCMYINKNAIGGFTNQRHWSDTPAGNNYYYMIDFYENSLRLMSAPADYSYSGYVRCVQDKQ